jgi:cellulose synthase/poly-beta-1,6-N-acetylglucosamine synthase-like glycosyltransferase
MFLLIVLWLIFFTLSFGFAGIIFITMRGAAKKPWRVKTDYNYKPKISIIVPTYNEASIICFKLENLVKVNYPKDLTQIIVVDSNSEDQTVDVVYGFIKQHPESDIQVLRQNERMGKSAALNFALKNCEGEIVIVSDVDCFWPSDILEKALPFLADPTVGAISGPKILLNPNQTWVTKSEDAYLNSMNLVKLGESKAGSTLLFEGGFSAYKREALASFDPYNTGSDDCGTIIKLVENGYRALFVPEARFYSAFVNTWKEKMYVKLRRANQLIRLFGKSFNLLLKGHFKSSRKIVMRKIVLYIVSPLMLVPLIITTTFLLLQVPLFALLFLIFLVSKVRVYLFELLQNYLILLLSMVTVALNKKFVIWNKPQDRTFIYEKVLHEYKLI